MNRTWAVAVVVLLGAGACGDAGPSTSASTAVAAGHTADQDFAVTATEYAFAVPDRVPGGVVTMAFDNDGDLRHEAGVVASGDTPLEQVRSDLAAVLEGGGGPIPDYLVFYGGVGEIAPGARSVSTFTLPEGDYVLYCSLSDIDSVDALPRFGPPAPAHYDSGMAAPFAVRRANVDMLPGDLPVLVATDGAFDLPPLTAGRQTVLFRNTGTQMHTAAVLAFPEGVGETAARRAIEGVLADPVAARPDGFPEPVDAGQAGPFPPRAGGTFEVDLEAGRTYAFVCVLTDRAGGAPHGARGMLEVFGV